MKRLDKRFGLYRHLLSLYPKSYREQFKDQILQTALDMLDNTSGQKERQKLWLGLAIDLPVDIGRQYLKHIGEYMKDFNQRLSISLIWLIIAALAWLAFPHIRAVGTTWMNTAGGLRVIALLLFIVIFMAAPIGMAVLALINRPKALYQKLLN